jgi:hypothetical protein
MTVYLVPRAYHRGMDDGLPHPTEALTLSEIARDLERVTGLLEQGGAVLVLSDDQERELGVLSRQEPLLGEARLAAMIDAGNIPPIAELLAMDDRGELP